MLNTKKLIDSVSQHLTETTKRSTSIFSTINLKYSYSQLEQHKDTAKHCNLNDIRGESTGSCAYKTDFRGLNDMTAKFQKAMDYTIIGFRNTFCFFDDIILVGTASESDHINYVVKCLKTPNENNLRINLQPQIHLND